MTPNELFQAFKDLREYNGATCIVSKELMVNVIDLLQSLEEQPQVSLEDQLDIKHLYQEAKHLTAPIERLYKRLCPQLQQPEVIKLVKGGIVWALTIEYPNMTPVDIAVLDLGEGYISTVSYKSHHTTANDSYLEAVSERLSNTMSSILNRKVKVELE